jgi:guanylate cyclase soluble subunit beta
MLMDASGDTLVEFLGNMNALHDRITGTFLNYVPPEFRVESLGGDYYRIHYISKREGLVPFVDGLLKGLAQRFGNELEVLDLTQLEVEKGTHAVYQVCVKS